MRRSIEEKVDERPRSGRLGVAIATYNSESQVVRCLEAWRNLDAFVVVYDDASRDRTVAAIRRLRPDALILHGNGDAWWAGGTNRAVEMCLKAGCEAILLLNPDVVITADQIRRLEEFALARKTAIVAGVIVDRTRPERLWYAGCQLEPVVSGLPWKIPRPVFPRGMRVDLLPSEPYRTMDMHARGVMVTSSVFERIGLLDERTFPHYGSDVDFAYRAYRAGVESWVLPDVRVVLDIEWTGMKSTSSSSLRDRLDAVLRYLTQRKAGESLRVVPSLYFRHYPVPVAAALSMAAIARGLGMRLYGR